LTYDSSTPDGVPDIATIGDYFGSVSAFTADLNGHHFAFDPNEDAADFNIYSDAFVLNDEPTDAILIQTLSGPGQVPPPGLPNYRVGLLLASFTNNTNALSSDALPADLRVLDNWLFGLVFADVDNFYQFEIDGNATLTPHVAVTAPATMPLFGLGLLALALALLRRRATVARRS
ncbi:MAG: hypothetical protein ACRET4_11430, partial [Steroidobacteraceae bacterium]